MRNTHLCVCLEHLQGQHSTPLRLGLLTRAVRAAYAVRTRAAGSVFPGLRGGLCRLLARLQCCLPHAQLKCVSDRVIVCLTQQDNVVFCQLVCDGGEGDRDACARVRLERLALYELHPGLAGTH